MEAARSAIGGKVVTGVAMKESRYRPTACEICREYSQVVYAWCRQAALQECDAADVTQTVMLKAIQAVRDGRFRGSRCKFRSWLRTIALNSIRDLVRSWNSPIRGQGMSQSINTLEFVEDQSFALAIQKRVDREHQRLLITTAERRVRKRIRERTWQVFVMCFRDDLSARDISRQLKIKLGEVYTIKSRVTAMLRDEVDRLNHAM